MGSLKKSSRVVLMTTLGKNIYKQISAAITTRIHMFIVILDHENMGVDTIFVTLLFIAKKLLKKIRFSIMAALICIYIFFVQCCHEDNPTKCLQEPHGKPNPPKTL